jgi:spermidine synthase
MTGKELLAFDKNNAIAIVKSNNKGQLVMHKAENGLMCKMASIACSNGGDILEIGFGLGLSANRVQSKSNVTSHTIIEVHPEIFDRAIKYWKPKIPNTSIIMGDWWNILPFNNRLFDGIIHDTHNDNNIHLFLNKVEPNCKKGTIVSFFEYPAYDSRIGIIEYEDILNEWQDLPYREYRGFYDKKFPLKYSVWDGIKWTSENINLANSK